jgi:DNA mismatch repair ATPase MutS
VDADEPIVAFNNLWVPVLNPHNVVTNDFVLGDAKKTKAVITGPNGGGKSTILKAVGQAVFMAQSWGIVPASSGKLTLFEGMRTCLHPEEDLQRGISTFMAENGRMQEIQDFMQECNEGNKKVLALIDEPYRGTVDAESAVRINAFGEHALSWPHAAVMLATHVHPDMVMSQFDGYQVRINEPSVGMFERTFKVEEGIAHWWFEDAARRSRFIDWLGKLHQQAKKPVEKVHGN